MGWKEYYSRPDIRPFAENYSAYVWAIHKLITHNPDLLDPQTSATFLLGGFTHTNSTRFDFEHFAHSIHPHPTLIFLDQNSLPLSITKHPNRVQAKLEKPPLCENSIDFMFLDHTQQFMDDSSLKLFFQSASNILKPNGLLLISNNEKIIPLPTTILNLFEKVPTFHRKSEDLCKSTFLKPVLKINATNNDLLVFSRQDSCYENHKGGYFYVDHDSII